MKTFLSAAAAGALLIGSAHAASFTVNFGAGSESSNDPATGASASIAFDFFDVGDDVRIELLVSNTTGSVPAFGDEATESVLTGIGFDLAGALGPDDVLSWTTGSALDTFGTDESLPPFGSFEIYFGDDDNFLGGMPSGLSEGTSESMSFVLDTDFDAMELMSAYLAAFQAGEVGAATRFQSVNAGEGSDKLLFDFLDSGGIVIDPIGNPIPVPGAALLMGTALLGGAGAMRRRKRS